MRIILVVGALAMAAPAIANDQVIDLAKTIQSCWSAPAGVEGQNLSAIFEIEIAEDGTVIDITAKKFPSGSVGKVFALSASRAIERCSPYNDLPKGKVTATFKVPTGKQPIDPFKPAKGN